MVDAPHRPRAAPAAQAAIDFRKLLYDPVMRKGGGGPDQAGHALLLGAGVRHLFALADASNFDDRGEPIEQPNGQLLFYLARAVQLLLAGDPVPGIPERRRKHTSVAMQEAKLDAATYVSAASGLSLIKGGPETTLREQIALRIADPDPIETVRLAYGMNSKEQVYGICKQKAFKKIDPVSRFPSLTYFDHLSYAAEWARGLKIKMLNGGKAWQAGRTQVAAAYQAQKPAGADAAK
jgi:hypothetical protein